MDLAKFDNKILRVALFDGEYKEHSHDDYEEIFIVYKGKITIVVDGERVELSEGQGISVPRGAKHKAIATSSSCVLFIDE